MHLYPSVTFLEKIRLREIPDFRMEAFQYLGRFDTSCHLLSYLRSIHHSPGEDYLVQTNHHRVVESLPPLLSQAHHDSKVNGASLKSKYFKRGGRRLPVTQGGA